MKMSIKLSDLCNQPPILEFEWFIIRPFDGHRLWIEVGGEGKTFTKAELMGALCKIWGDGI